MLTPKEHLIQPIESINLEATDKEEQHCNRVLTAVLLTCCGTTPLWPWSEGFSSAARQ